MSAVVIKLMEILKLLINVHIERSAVKFIAKWSHTTLLSIRIQDRGDRWCIQSRVLQISPRYSFFATLNRKFLCY